MVAPISKASWLTRFLQFRDTPISQLCISAFEEVYKRHASKLSISIQSSELNETHLDPVICVYDTQSKEIIAQIFNFIDVLGGKQGVTADAIEKYLIVRGIIEPKGSDYATALQTKKD